MSRFPIDQVWRGIRLTVQPGGCARWTHGEPPMTKLGSRPDRAIIRSAEIKLRAARIDDAIHPTPVPTRSGHTSAVGSVGAREFLQSQVNPAPMVIVHERLKVLVQTAFVEHDQVIQALAADSTNDPLDVSTLPR